MHIIVQFLIASCDVVQGLALLLHEIMCFFFAHAVVANPDSLFDVPAFLIEILGLCILFLSEIDSRNTAESVGMGLRALCGAQFCSPKTSLEILHCFCEILLIVVDGADIGQHSWVYSDFFSQVLPSHVFCFVAIDFCL